jgi:hypothetical protein
MRLGEETFFIKRMTLCPQVFSFLWQGRSHKAAS